MVRPGAPSAKAKTAAMRRHSDRLEAIRATLSDLGWSADRDAVVDATTHRLARGMTDAERTKLRSDLDRLFVQHFDVLGG